MNPIPVWGILKTELIEAAGIAVRSLVGQGSGDPWHRGPETGFAARETPLGAWLLRLAGLARKGGPGDLQDARTRNVISHSLAPVEAQAPSRSTP